MSLPGTSSLGFPAWQRAGKARVGSLLPLLPLPVCAGSLTVISTQPRSWGPGHSPLLLYASSLFVKRFRNYSRRDPGWGSPRLWEGVDNLNCFLSGSGQLQLPCRQTLDFSGSFWVQQGHRSLRVSQDLHYVSLVAPAGPQDLVSINFAQLPVWAQGAVLSWAGVGWPADTWWPRSFTHSRGGWRTGKEGVPPTPAPLRCSLGIGLLRVSTRISLSWGKKLSSLCLCLALSPVGHP